MANIDIETELNLYSPHDGPYDYIVKQAVHYILESGDWARTCSWVIRRNFTYKEMMNISYEELVSWGVQF